jgi:hypothetical protein
MIRLILFICLIGLGIFVLVQFLRSIWPEDDPTTVTLDQIEKLGSLYKPIFYKVYNSKSFIFGLLDSKEHKDLKDTLSSLGIIESIKETVKAAFNIATKLSSIEEYVSGFPEKVIANKKQHIEELKVEIPYHRNPIAQTLTKQVQVETDELAYIEELKAKQARLTDELDFIVSFMQNVQTYVVKLSVGDDLDMVELQAGFDCLSSSLSAVDEVQKIDKRGLHGKETCNIPVAGPSRELG